MIFNNLLILIVFFEFAQSLAIQNKPICVVHNLFEPKIQSFCEILQQRPNNMMSISQRHENSIAVTTEVLKRFRELPSAKVVIGASTIRTKSQALSVIEGGASFLSTMNYSPEILRVCLQRNIPLLCGVQSVQECLQAISNGATHLKLYPFTSFLGNELKTMIHNIRRFHPNTYIVAAGGVTTAHIPTIAELGFDSIAIGRDLSSDVSINSIFDEYEYVSKLWEQEKSFVKQ